MNTIKAVVMALILSSCTIQDEISDFQEEEVYQDAQLENIWYYESGSRYVIYKFTEDEYRKTNGIYGVGSSEQVFHYEIEGDTIFSTLGMGENKSYYKIEGDSLTFENRKMVKL